ncbi:MAG: type II secretion system F family protein [Planctomycetota bacterium]
MDEHFEGTPIPPRSPLPLTGVSKRRRALFYTQLARMLRAGLSPVKALTTLSRQAGSRRLARAAGQMAAHIQDGGTLGSAFARQPNLFPRHEVRMVEAAERGGDAPTTMGRIAGFLDELVAAQRRALTGMIYPALCLFLVFIVLPNVAWFFLPDVFPRVWPYQVMLLAGAVAAWLAGAVVWRSLTALSAIRSVVHGVLNCVPVVGGVLRKLAWARWANTFKCLYTAGVLVHEALVVSGRACGNAVIGARIVRAAPAVREGTPIAEALASARAVPSLAVELLAVGEEAGKLDEALARFAQYQEEELTTSIQRLSRVLVVLVILGYILVMVFLIFMVFSVLLSTYQEALGG